MQMRTLSGSLSTTNRTTFFGHYSGKNRPKVFDIGEHSLLALVYRICHCIGEVFYGIRLYLSPYLNIACEVQPK